MLKGVRAAVRRLLATIGHALGTVVMHCRSRPARTEFPVPVHLLLSSSSWHCGLLAAISLESVSEKNWRFVFHDDGSITERQRRRIEQTFPGSRFVTRAEAEEKTVQLLGSFPRCRRQRAGHNFFLKLFDPHGFAGAEKYITLDSDVIFFRRPGEIIDWATGDSDRIHYNRDAREKYCSPRAELQNALGLELLPRFNSGLILMPRAAVDWQLAERFVAQFEATAHHPQFFEQTLYALMASAWGRVGALPPSYEISWGYFRRCGAVCRHYVGEFKHDLLYIEAAPLLLVSVLRNKRKKL